jgi:hypothetical protein
MPDPAAAQGRSQIGRRPCHIIIIIMIQVFGLSAATAPWSTQ